MGLTKKSSNVPRIILENLIRWGLMGRIFGVNPTSPNLHVDGVHVLEMAEFILKFSGTSGTCSALQIEMK